MSEKVKPFSSQDKYTTFENVIIDHLLPIIPPNAWKCLTLIMRKTIGWHKDRDEISFSQIKAGTGIKNNGTVTKALKDLERMGLVMVIRSRNQWDTNIYILNTDFEIEVPSTEIVPEEATPSTKIVPEPSTEIVPALVRKSYIQKKGKEKESTTKALNDFKILFEQHFGKLSSHEDDPLRLDVMTTIKTHSLAKVIAAIHTATVDRVDGNPKSWGYVKGILSTPDQPTNGGKPNERSNNNRSKNSSRRTGEDLEQQPTFDPSTGHLVPAA